MVADEVSETPIAKQDESVQNVIGKNFAFSTRQSQADAKPMVC